MLILAKVFGLAGILWAGPVAEVLAFFLAAVLAVRELKKWVIRDWRKGPFSFQSDLWQFWADF